VASWVRPLIAVGLTTTLCILAIAQTAGWGNPPQWFLGVSIPVVSGLLIERGITKAKGR